MVLHLYKYNMLEEELWGVDMPPADTDQERKLYIWETWSVYGQYVPRNVSGSSLYN